jgi:hypothetical protein
LAYSGRIDGDNCPYHVLMDRSATEVTPEVVERADTLEVSGRAGVGMHNMTWNDVAATKTDLNWIEFGWIHGRGPDCIR